MQWFYDGVQQYRDKTAIIYAGKSCTYGDLLAEIEKCDKMTRSEIPTKAIVAIGSGYSFRSIALFNSLFKNKNIIVPIISEVPEEIEERLKVSQADFIIYPEKDYQLKRLEKAGPKHPLYEKLYGQEHPGLVLFSSGSTGEPKGMVHDLHVLSESYSHRKQKDINTLVFLTFDHIGGIDTLLRNLSIFGTITIPENHNPAYVCELIEKFKVNVLPASPTFLNLLLLSEAHKRYDLSCLQIIGYGAEPMPESLLKRLKEAFPNVKLQQKFGTSETNAVKVVSKEASSLYIKIDDPNIEHKIVSGELWLKSKTKVLGYLNASMENFMDGWFKTGDLVEKDEDGFLKIIGRNKEVINVGGEKVLPSEVESAILEFPGVMDCMVYGWEHVLTGQMVVADIVKSNPDDNFKKELRKFLKASLDAYKIPMKFNFVDRTNFNERFKKIRRK